MSGPSGSSSCSMCVPQGTGRGGHSGGDSEKVDSPLGPLACVLLRIVSTQPLSREVG